MELRGDGDRVRTFDARGTSGRPRVEPLGPGSSTPFFPEPHKHRDAQLILLAVGGAEHRVADLATRYTEPAWILIPPLRTHAWGPQVPPRGVAVQFESSLVEHSTRLPETLRDGLTWGITSPAVSAGRWKRAQRILLLLQDEALDVGAAALLVGALLIEAFPQPHIESMLPYRGIVREFCRAVTRAPSAAHGVAWHARQLRVSERQLSREVRVATGRTPGSHVRAGLAEEAGRLLREGDLTVAQVAARLGFADPSYFSRFVLRELGARPGSIRARYAAGGDSGS